MGKTSKPLTIVVHPTLRMELGGQLTALTSQGHTVSWMDSEIDGEYVANADLIVAPNAWRMFGALTKYLDVAIKGARVTAYPPKKRSETSN